MPPRDAVASSRHTEADIARRGPPRQPLQELPPSDVVDSGRLRLVNYPVLDTDAGRVEHMALELQTYRGATALPLVPIEGTNRTAGAVYSRRGRLVRDSERAIGGRRGPWHSNQRKLREDLPTEATVLPGRSFFLGHWSPGFGHVLLDMLPRLWPPQDYGDYDHFVVYPWRMDATPVLEPTTWLRDLLDACGIPFEKVVVVRKEPVGFEALDVTTSPFILKSVADPRFLDVFAAIKTHVLEASDAQATADLPARVYLSRSQLPGRVAVNEEDIEALMARRGFAVLHPQHMTIAEQVAMLAQVEVIAGGDGSALHMAAFARPGTKLLALDSRVVPSQFVIDRARELDAVHLLAVDAVVRRVAKWRADAGQVEAALDLLLAGDDPGRVA